MSGRQAPARWINSADILVHRAVGADKDVFRPAAWNAFGMDKEGQDYRACAAYGPMYKNIR